MGRSWTFSQKIGAGLTIVVILSMLVAGLSSYSLDRVVGTYEDVLEESIRNQIEAEQLRAAIERKGGAHRGFLLTADAQFLTGSREARSNFQSLIRSMRGRTSDPRELGMLDEIERLEEQHQEVGEQIVELRRNATAEQAAQVFDERQRPRRVALDRAITSFVDLEKRRSSDGQRSASDQVAEATRTLALGTILVLALAIGVALTLSGTLRKQIGSAVSHVESSSAELQTAANQQATSSKEQATAMNEIATTITELLATSKQIAESAQRVSQIADETATTARTGEATMARTSDAIGGIKRQVDLIVTHMLDLGRKSQQIGGILELINELAEQTNILAINATIEAAGAGESGRRFAVVADEIRKLADRVAGSTREIRGLIDEIRSAVNATVMTTEGGTKAVESGTRQFSEVASAFQQISGRVGTTTQAAREIELSTKQQATAVEQVNLAVANVAQATMETEASSSQTLQTASQLSQLSRDLVRLIRPEAA